MGSCFTYAKNFLKYSRIQRESSKNIGKNSKKVKIHSEKLKNKRRKCKYLKIYN